MPDPNIDPPPHQRNPRSAKFIVFFVIVIDLLGFGIVLPLLPLFAESYVKEAMGEANTRMNGLVVGLLMASFSAMQFFFAPLWGRVSDRVGRRPILLLGLGGSVVFYCLFGYACDLPAQDQALLALVLLFVARIGAGVAGATIATAQAVIADCTPAEDRKHGMALIGMAFGTGFTFGPLVGFLALLFFPGYHGSIGYVAAGLSALALLLGFILMPETRDFEAAPPLERRWLNLRATGNVLTNPALAPVILAFFLATLGFASFEVTLALMNKQVLGLEERFNFLIFAYVGLVLAVTQGGIYRRVARRFNEASLMTIGITFMGLGVLFLGGVTYLAYLPTDHPWHPGFALLLTAQMISLALAVVGFAFLTPSAQALVSRRSDQARQGEVLGVNQSCSALARILGPIMGLVLYFIYTPPLLPYVTGGTILLLMLLLIPVIRRGDDVFQPDEAILKALASSTPAEELRLLTSQWIQQGHSRESILAKYEQIREGLAGRETEQGVVKEVIEGLRG